MSDPMVRPGLLGSSSPAAAAIRNDMRRGGDVELARLKPMPESRSRDRRKYSRPEAAGVSSWVPSTRCALRADSETWRSRADIKSLAALGDTNRASRSSSVSATSPRDRSSALHDARVWPWPLLMDGVIGPPLVAGRSAPSRVAAFRGKVTTRWESA